METLSLKYVHATLFISRCCVSSSLCGSQPHINRHLCWSQQGSSAGSSGQKVHRTLRVLVVRGKRHRFALAPGCLWVGTASFSELCIQQALERVLPPHAGEFLPWAAVW